jgi:hypothetical protein
MPSGIYKIAGLPLDHGTLECALKVDDAEIQALLNEPLKPKKKKANKKGAEGEAVQKGQKPEETKHENAKVEEEEGKMDAVEK